MTKEERVEKLRCLITCMKCEMDGKECDANCHVQYEAGNMGEIIENLEAISKALEQEPCDNAVSRQAVIDIVDSYSDSQSNVEDVTQDIISDIVALPPVNPQPKTGHWILTNDDDYEYCTCSECGYQNGENWMIGSQIKYCQECGCRMVEPQESEEV
jgi:hypothetical protein